MASITIGFVGLGRMGRPMAGHLQSKGFVVQGYDPHPAEPPTVPMQASVAAAVEGAEVVFTMLPASGEVRAVVEAGILPHAAAGTLVVDMSTIDPATTDDLAAACTSRGLGFVDAPVGRTAAHADRAESLFMVGATPAELDRLEPLLGAMGSTVIHCGPVGTGIRTKLVNNLLAIALAQLDAEVLALAQRFGLDLATTLRVLTGTTATNGHLTANFPNKVLKGDTAPGFSIDLAHKDLSLALASAGQLGVAAPMGAAARECLGLARADGRGGEDFSALLDHWCARVGVASPRL